MNLYLIKVLGIFIVTVCCIIATYTDVKRQIIPNKLTITTIITGVLLLSIYYYIVKDFRITYYLSILIVYLFSYVLWRLGVWAGGDVKLFTAISTLLVPEFLDVMPCFNLFGITFPMSLYLFHIPTFFVVFNSILSIIPLLLLYVCYKIIKDRRDLITKFKNSFDFKEVFLSLNSLLISYLIISRINVHYLLIKLVLMIIVSYALSKIMKYDCILYLFTVVIILQQVLTSNIHVYLEELLVMISIISIKNMYKSSIIKEALSKKVDVSELEEGMILQYPLYYYKNSYYFDKSPWYEITKQKGELICSNYARGINTEDIQILKKECNNSKISIKKGFPFAPFILVGLVITIIFGNTYQLILFLMELI